MAQAKSSAAPPHPRRRPTVRIVKPRVSRAAMISLLVTIVTAAVLFGVWRFFQEVEHPVIVRRGLSDVYLDWKCEVGHSFRALGQMEPRTCPRCGRRSYPVADFRCSDHGDYAVAVRYSLDADDQPQPTEFRVGRGRWVSAENLRCPRCRRPLVRKPKDPFEDQARGRGRSGG